MDYKKLCDSAVKYGSAFHKELDFSADRGYFWAPGEDGIPVLMKDGKNQMSPITKVYKRLLNGPEDNVKSFYVVALLIADGRLNLSHGDKKG
ncbi:MAG: hypothetical protein LUK37_01695 [Clostridia bacterium]|nr:hypothetical protein [Clostridia bacterium]